MTRRIAARAMGAAALAAAFAVCAPAPASAQGWTANEDDSLLFNLRSGQYRLGDMLRGYQTGDGVCIDMNDLVQALDLPIRIDRKSRRATGWIFAENERFTLDREGFTVQTMNGEARVSETDIHDTPEGWCASTGALSRWFGVTFRPDVSNLQIVIETDRKLPFLQAIERKSRAARLRPAQEFDLASLPRADFPYKSWRAPSIDVMLRASWRDSGSRGGAQRTVQYEALASGEALGVSYQARLVSDDKAVPDTLRVKAYRVDEAGGLLGPLKATQAAAGDVESYASALTGQSAVGRGVFISNRPPSRPARFSTTTLRGALPAGWDAELYRNGQLIAFQQGRNDGRYEFPDVEMMFGDNDFEVVLYGPQGQIRRESSRIPVGIESIPAGKTWYWASALQQDRDLIDFNGMFADPLTGWRWGVGVERGIDKRTTLGVGAQSLILEGIRHNYAEASLTRAIGPMLVELSGAKEFGSGMAFQGQAIGRIGPVNFQAEALWVDGGFTSEVVTPEIRRNYGLRLDSHLSLGETRLPVQLALRRSENRDGKVVNEWLTRLSLIMRGISLTGEVSRQTSHGGLSRSNDDGTYLRVLANTGIGKVRLRGAARFRLAGGEKGFESAEVNAETRLTDRSSLRTRMSWFGQSRRGELGVSYIRDFDRLALRAEALVGTKGNYGAGLSLAFSFGPDAADGGWRMSGDKLAQYGHALVEVFRDENGDGVRQAGEGPVDNAEVAATYALRQYKTNAAGRTMVDGLRPFAPVALKIDESSIEDPLLKPKGQGVVVVPRPGVSAKVLLPLSPTGEIEGALLGADGEPREGLTIELVDASGRVERQVLSEFDGYFLFDGVPYGDYRLRLSAASAKALGVGQDLGLSVRIDRTKASQRIGQLRLRKPAEVAVAP